MATLTQAAIFSKKASFWILIGLVVLIFVLILLAIGKRVKSAFFPPPPLPASVAFGKLPKVDLGEGIRPAGDVNYTLETISGDLPALPGMAKVLAVAEPEPSFGDLERIKTRFAKIGFLGEPVEISPGRLKFNDPANEARILTVERLSGNFTLESDWANNAQVIASRPASVAEAQQKAETFLRGLGIDTAQLAPERIEVRKLRIDGGALTETPAMSSANLLEVNFSRSDIDGLPVIWPRLEKSKVSVLISQRGVEEATFEVLPLQKFKFATYPLRGTVRAFEDLKEGKGVFSNDVGEKEIVIVDVSLGYVETDPGSRFLQPFYFFKGLEKFIAYVPAVDQRWVE